MNFKISQTVTRNGVVPLTQNADINQVNSIQPNSIYSVLTDQAQDGNCRMKKSIAPKYYARCSIQDHLSELKHKERTFFTTKMLAPPFYSGKNSYINREFVNKGMETQHINALDQFDIARHILPQLPTPVINEKGNYQNDNNYFQDDSNNNNNNNDDDDDDDDDDDEYYNNNEDDENGYDSTDSVLPEIGELFSYPRLAMPHDVFTQIPCTPNDSLMSNKLIQSEFFSPSAFNEMADTSQISEEDNATPF